MLVFTDLATALKSGFQVYDRTSTGYVVRKRIGPTFQLALVELSKPPEYVLPTLRDTGDSEC